MTDLSAVTSTTITGRSIFGNKRITWGTIVLGDGTNTMPAAGLAVTAANLGQKSVDAVQLNNAGTGSYRWSSDVIYGEAAASPASDDTVNFVAFGYGIV